MAMSTTPPPSANSGTICKIGESAEYMFGSSVAQPAGHNGNSRNSAEQPVDGTASSAEQPLSSFAPYLPSTDKRAAPDVRGEKQPKKRCNHNLVMVAAEDFMMPEILQSIQKALAQEIDKFKAECEQWDPPNFEEDATEESKPIFRLRNVYERLRSIKARGCLPTYTSAQIGPVYAVIKGLLAFLHSDVDSSAYRFSPKKQAAANELYVDFCSHERRTLALNASSLELLAFAVRHEMLADRMDCPRHATRYFKYLADFAELHAL